MHSVLVLTVICFLPGLEILVCFGYIFFAEPGLRVLFER